jgi:hypothetical protein
MTFEVGKFMKKFLISAIVTFLFASFAFAQNNIFKDANVEYTFELPSATWKKVVFPTVASPNVEYVYGDRLDGHFEIRRTKIGKEEIISDLITRDKEEKFQFEDGFVAGKEESFNGALDGKVYNYEYTKAGKLMSSRFYYLRANNSNDIYVLRFRGYRAKLLSIRNEVDAIARSFKIKDKTGN